MMLKNRILLIDDSLALRKELVSQFAHCMEFETTDVANAKDAIEAVEHRNFDLILINHNLPDMLGSETCQIMRDQGVKTPIIMLTPNADAANEVLGLNCGVNDCITKPFHFALLLARIKAHLPAIVQSDNVIFKIGPYEFKPTHKRLTPAANGLGKQPRDIYLTDKEVNVLKYLYRAGGKPVGREELLHKVWGYNENVSTHTVETHVYRLRQKIEPVKGRPTLLVTEPGGYRLSVG